MNRVDTMRKEVREELIGLVDFFNRGRGLLDKALGRELTLNESVQGSYGEFVICRTSRMIEKRKRGAPTIAMVRVYDNGSYHTGGREIVLEPILYSQGLGNGRYARKIEDRMHYFAHDHELHLRMRLL